MRAARQRKKNAYNTKAANEPGSPNYKLPRRNPAEALQDYTQTRRERRGINRQSLELYIYSVHVGQKKARIISPIELSAACNTRRCFFFVGKTTFAAISAVITSGGV